MPKISDAHREQRRLQILEAAWRCFQREGIQATRIEHILAESGMAASALYRYFKNKDDIILAAIAHSMYNLLNVLEPLAEHVNTLSPEQYLVEVVHTIHRFSERSGYNLMSIAVHGWSEAQRNPAIRVLLSEYYGRFKDHLAQIAEKWQHSGQLSSKAKPVEVAQLMLGLILGSVVQTTILGGNNAVAIANGLHSFRR